jgi:hypothetical protein
MEVEFELGGVVHRLRIDKPVFHVGRVAGNELRINDGTVSSKHARVLDNPNLAIVEDLGSTNGTRLNNEPITEAAVKPGDTVTFGQVHVRILSCGPADGAVAEEGAVVGEGTLAMGEGALTQRMTLPPGGVVPGPSEEPGALELVVAGADLAGSDSKEPLIPPQRLAAALRHTPRIAAARNLPELAERLGQAALAVARAQGVEVFFCDEASGAPARHFGRSADGAEMPPRDDAAMAAFSALIAAGKASLTPAAGPGVPRSLYAPLLGGEGGERRLGLLGAYVTGPVGGADLRLLAILATEAGAALDAVRHTEKLRRAYDELVKEQTETVAECDQLEAALKAAQAEVARLAAQGGGGRAAAAPPAAEGAPKKTPSSESVKVPTPTGAGKTPSGEVAVPKGATSVGIAIPGAEMKYADLGPLLDAILVEMRAPIPQVQALLDQTFRELERETAAPLIAQILIPARPAALQLAVLLNDISELAEIEGGRVKPEPIAVDARALIGEVHHHEGMAAAQKNVRIHLDAPSAPVMVLGDPRRLVQMLHHIVSTAVKLTLPGKEMTLTLAEVEGRARFTVRDPVGPLVHTGIGVAIAKRLAPILKASFKVDGDPTRGTAMTFTVPLVK